MSQVTKLLTELEEQGCLLASPYIMAEALEKNVREVIEEFLSSSKHCKTCKDEDTWIIPGNRLLKISAVHPLLSTCFTTLSSIQATGVVINVAVARLENLRNETKQQINVTDIDGALKVMTNIVYGIDPPADEESGGEVTK